MQLTEKEVLESQIRQLLNDLRYRHRDSVETADDNIGHGENWHRGKASAYADAIDRIEIILHI